MRYIFGTISTAGQIEFTDVDERDFYAKRDEFKYDGDLLGYSWQPFYGGHREAIQQEMADQLKHKFEARKPVTTNTTEVSK